MIDWKKIAIFISSLAGLATAFGNPQAEKTFKEWDKNNDGFLEREEVPPGPRRIFEKKDLDGNGKVSLEEHLGKRRPTLGPSKKSENENQTEPAFTIRQTWAQEPDGFDRPVYAHLPENRKEKTGVVIYFHGNGGSAAPSLRNWARLFPDRFVFSAQGYEKSWNISGERSRAPDVEFFKTLIEKIGTTHPEADMKDVSLIGSSNGAGYIHRLMIEIDEPLFKNAIPTVASMIEKQYHDGSFWKPSGDTDRYDTKVNPAGGRRILYIHGTDDKVVPFEGGKRGNTPHLSAHETAFRWAQVQGYEGDSLENSDGKTVSKGVIVYQYDDADVTFVKLIDGNHGMGPYREEAQRLIKEFVERG